LVFREARFRTASDGDCEEKNQKKSWANEANQSHGEAEAERLVAEALAALGVSSERKDLEGTRKGDQPKVLVAALLRKTTAVGNGWIAERLCMGHSGSVTRLVVAASKDAKHGSELKKLMKLLKCDS
jgi:hypothetical protein